jgi:hypothetical protein
MLNRDDELITLVRRTIEAFNRLDFKVNGSKVLVRNRATGRGAGSGIELGLHRLGRVEV